MAKVELRGVSKTYDNGVKALANIDLTVEDKQFVVLLGPRGCGKTTTLRIISGLEEPSEGEILIDGIPMNDISPKDRNTAMVFQENALYQDMTVYNNMAFGLKNRKAKKEEIDALVKETAAKLGIEKLLDRKPKALSEIQKRRVAIARAIVRKPKVFLLDEPFSNLDAKPRFDLRNEILRLFRELNATLIYVTGDYSESMTSADKIVVFSMGKVQQSGTPFFIYRHPANKFVADFSGFPFSVFPSMNFFTVEVIDNNGEIIVDEGSFQLKALPEQAEHLRQWKGKKVYLGIRAEDFKFQRKARIENSENIENIESSGQDGSGGGRDESVSNESVITLKVSTIEHFGSYFAFWLYSKSGCGVIVRADSTNNFTPDVLSPGELAVFTVDMSKTCFFDTETENSIIPVAE